MKMTSALPCALVALTLAFTNTYAQELVATEAARSNDYTSPVDTTPSPDGATFYFLAIGNIVERKGATSGYLIFDAVCVPCELLEIARVYACVGYSTIALLSLIEPIFDRQDTVRAYSLVSICRNLHGPVV